MSELGPWPRSEFVSIGGPDMPMAERVTRYRANVMAIHEAGHAVPSPTADTLDAAEIEAWITRLDETTARLAGAMRRIGQLPDDTIFSSPLGCWLFRSAAISGRAIPSSGANFRSWHDNAPS